MAKLFINEKKKTGTINREIYGHFAEHLGRCIYEGLYVGEDSPIPNKKGMRTDVVEALKELWIPVLRWPGGCFADEYHWKDGIGPREGRKKMINTHWGGVLEDNSFGTHEFMELCEQLGCKTYVNGNVGSGTVQEMSEWIEYMTFDGVSPLADLRRKNGREEPFRVDYFGVGNENWGCGGNMTPQYYASLYRRYQTYVRTYDREKPVFKICGGANVDDYHWTEQVLRTTHDHTLKELHGFMDGLSLHYYVHPGGWENKGSATRFDEREWFRTMGKAFYMEELIKRHGEIMDRYDPERIIGMIVDEWGCWFDVEPGTNPGFLYQQNTMRDAMVACVTLNIFNKHCDRVKMANLAQVVNVLQSVILTDKERMLLTPTWHIFHMYRYHQDGSLLDSSVEAQTTGPQEYRVPDLSESVSMDQAGHIHVTLGNLRLQESREIEVRFREKKASNVTGTILTGAMNAYNTFEEPEKVKEKAFDGCVIGEDAELRFTLPACSVVHLEIQ